MSHPSQSHSVPPPRLSLRYSALWYPDIPPSGGLLLNEDSFTGDDPLVTNYRPLSWIHFGGKTGKSLDHVQGIRIQFSGVLYGLQFVYDEASTEDRFEKLGCCSDEVVSYRPRFPIDGAGGERINSISVGMRCPIEGNISNPLQRMNCIKVNPLRFRRRTLTSGAVTFCRIDEHKSRQGVEHCRGVL